MPRCLLVLLWVVVLASPALADDDADGIGDDVERIALPSTRPTTKPAETLATRAARRNPPNVVDRLQHVVSAEEFSEGTLQNANVIPGPPAKIQLGYRLGKFPRVGTWTGPEVETKFPFSDLIATMNPDTPADTGVALEVRVKQAAGWSPWLFMQNWGRTITPAQRANKFDGGEVATDELELKSPAEAYQLRVTLYHFGFDKNTAPSVRRLSVSFSGVIASKAERDRFVPKTKPAPTGWDRDLSVPFRGQGDYKNPKALWGEICSPTSVAMVCAYHGIDKPTIDHAQAIYDSTYDLFGNWGRAVSHAGALGLDAWVDRFRDWEKVKAEIAIGNPVIASIRFGRGEVKGFLYPRTRGHLLVIRGFKPDGSVIVNDPAKRDKGAGVVIPAAEFAKAWFDNGGVGYVIHKPKTN